MKGFLRQSFEFCVSKLGLFDIYDPTWGRGVLELVDLL